MDRKNFLKPDPIEDYMGKTVTEMNDTELVTYIKTYLQNVHDVILPVTEHRERAIMASLKRVYGSDAGLIVKWALWDEPRSYDDFNKGRKWKTDRWYVELQAHIKSSKNKGDTGFARLEEI